MSDPAPDKRTVILPQNFVAQLVRGFTYPLRGLGFIRRHRLWALAGVAIGVNIAVFAALAAASVYFAEPWLAQAEAWVAQSFVSFLSGVVYWAGLVLLLIIDAVLLVLLGQAIASPFLDALSERIESIAIGRAPKPTSFLAVVRSLIMGVVDLFWAVVFLVGISLLGLIVPPLAPFIGFLFGALLLAQEFVGLAMTRKLQGYLRRWQVVWRNRWLSLGFGAATMLLLVVPGVNLILLPLAAAGGTLLYTDLEAAERL